MKVKEQKIRMNKEENKNKYRKGYIVIPKKK
jgi:hypothetical protein